MSSLYQRPTSAELKRIHDTKSYIFGGCTVKTEVVPVLLGDVQGHHGEGLCAVHHPAQPLADTARLGGQEVVGHAAPDDWRQHLDVQAGRTLGHRVPALAAEHGRRDGHDVLKRAKEEILSLDY